MAQYGQPRHSVTFYSRLLLTVLDKLIQLLVLKLAISAILFLHQVCLQFDLYACAVGSFPVF